MGERVHATLYKSDTHGTMPSEFTFEWGVYVQLASDAIFRARAYLYKAPSHTKHRFKALTSLQVLQPEPQIRNKVQHNAPPPTAVL